jgi:hypothetical protein
MCSPCSCPLPCLHVNLVSGFLSRMRSFFPSQRLTFPPQAWISAYGAMLTSWSAFSNTLGQDFNLYGSVADLNASTNAWQFCGQFDTVGVAFPGNCGPTAAQVH